MGAVAASLATGYAQYGGPALLTRGQAPTAMGATQIDFRPFLTVNAGYSTGLNGVSVDANGKPTEADSLSLGITAGVSGLHSWKHTLVGLDYRASFSHYTKQAFFDGSEQSLSLGITHMLSRHVMVSVRNSAGMHSQSLTTPTLLQTIPFDPLTTYIPTNDFFDNRTVYLSTQADLRVIKSTRLSYDIGGDIFITRRRSTALYGNYGYAARGDLQYRLSRRSTIGASYGYTHYDFKGILSSTDVHTFNGTYAIGISKTLEIGTVVGVSFLETKFKRVVPIDPVVAAVICPPPELSNGIPCVATQLFYTRVYTPSISARLSKTIPRGVLFLSGGHSVVPGNGLFLTSKQTSISGGYSYTGLKRWSINTSATYSNSTSVGNVLGQYAGVGLNANVARHLRGPLHFVGGAGAHRYQSQDFRNYNRWIYNVNVGFGFTPGDIPIRLW
jgi:hypothetical protein